jgi:serine/threonine-protein kinase RsbW
VEISFSLVLPRDLLSVPVVRQTCRGAMIELGVDPECVGEVALAVTEACANAVQHSADGENEFEVRVKFDDAVCEIRVFDRGSGFDADLVSVPEDSAERGRGIQLMRALVDKVQFESRPEEGTIVCLVKRLDLVEGAILREIAARAAR